MLEQNLSSALTKDVLNYLGCPMKSPTLRYLNQLIHAYVRKVPWESVSRIVKRQATRNIKDCPRLPEEFWSDALQHGFGGTCYESSFAFYCLLTALGYEGYLTVNNMGETRGCHAAITLLLGRQKYLVDITIPIHTAMQINPQKITRRQTPFHDFAIHPVRENVYQVTRSHHSHRIAFTLIDTPVSLHDYLTIMKNDYKETGYFLNSVVMNKVINGQTTLFFSDKRPFKLERFNRGGKEQVILDVETLSHTLEDVFKMPEAKIAAALSHIQGVNR